MVIPKRNLIPLFVVALVVAAIASVPTQATPLPSTGTLILPDDQAFRCNNYAQPMNFDKVKVNLTPAYTGAVDDALNLNGGDCTGRIGRIEIDTSIGDGVKVGAVAHDLTIQGGYVYCHARKDTKHQDGIQALGGTHVHFQNISVYCPTSNNASFFADGTTNTPTDVTCGNCNLDGGAQTVSLAQSADSGAFDSLVHMGKFTVLRTQTSAIRPVFANNVVLPCDLNCT